MRLVPRISPLNDLRYWLMVSKNTIRDKGSTTRYTACKLPQWHICLRIYCEMVRALAHEGLWELDGVERDGWVDGSS